MAISAHMLLKTLICILVLVIVAEGGYIFLHRHPINRFKPMDDDGYVAFDTASGQLCRTFRSKSAPKRIESSPSSDHSSESGSEDPILGAIRNGRPNAQVERETQVEFIRGLPTCDDIR